MPRDIPVGNGQMLVCFDQHYQIRDFYYPHVGQENHLGGSPCRFGVWAAMPPGKQQQDRRKRRLFWTDQGWHTHLTYQPDTLATRATLSHDQLEVRLECCDVVDFHRPLLVRRVEVHNLDSAEREVRLFHHQDFHIYGTKVGDTAYFDPQTRSVIHYRQSRYLMATWWSEGETRVDEYATGMAGFRGAEGTWRDAEDGALGNNAIAQGAVDSTIMLSVTLPPKGSRTVYLIIGAGQSYQDLHTLHGFLTRHGPQDVIDRTISYWRLWLDAVNVETHSPSAGGPSQRVIELYKRSLLLVRSQIDNSGAIIAANDSDIMQFSRDTYSYLWPRDGALVAAALDASGFPDAARLFYSLCSRIITEHGFFYHKYNPDGTPASSWHPWVSLGKPQVPIQEDETALVLWALWRHYEQYRDIEFVRPLWVDLIIRAADFLVRFRDPVTHLPLPSYDLWEERWGVNAYTVAAVYGGLRAACCFASKFGDVARATVYEEAAGQIHAAFCKHFWSEAHGRFRRRIVPLDHNRTALMMADVLAGRAPTARELPAANGKNGNGKHAAHAKPRTQDPVMVPESSLEFEYDSTIDSALYGIFAFGLLDVHDERVVKTMQAVESRLWCKTPVGGIARYDGDHYHRVTDDLQAVPGNPWFICTLWLADWRIARAGSIDELREALPILEWIADRALPSGVLAEQVHPFTNAPLSVSPLTWSHASVVHTVTAYLHKLQQMNACPSCGQPQQCVIATASSRRPFVAVPQAAT
jgi:oligosaccharide amylase